MPVGYAVVARLLSVLKRFCVTAVQKFTFVTSVPMFPDYVSVLLSGCSEFVVVCLLQP